MTTTGQNLHRISAVHWLGASGAQALGTMLVAAALGTLSAQAQTYTVLHRFTGTPDGASPAAGLIGHGAGGLAGTTQGGGAYGYGTVFKLDTTGESVLYSFTGGLDGANPVAGLIRDAAGNLFGTTVTGGDFYGTVFKLDTGGTETVLHSFRDRGGDGGFPVAGLAADSAGNLYGTATEGGLSNVGIAFKLNSTGETMLHTFAGVPDGSAPAAGLIRDSAGNLYGTTPGGGAMGWGTVYKIDTAGTETVLYSFTGGADGGMPYASLIEDSAGNLYGTTTWAGIAAGSAGFGVVFKLDTAGTETVLYTFTGGADGGYPAAGLVQDSEGNLYGTTQAGGTGSGFSGDGVVFKLSSTGTETVLHTFTGGTDGLQPLAGLLRDSSGNLYGTAVGGGITNSGCPFGCGIVFKIAP
jgi:uncharacterized repeat protein (TIGR03803 family)